MNLKNAKESAKTEQPISGISVFETDDPDKFFNRYVSNLGGRSLKLQKRYSRTDNHNHLFTNRIIDSWNGLSERSNDSGFIEHFHDEIEVSGHRLKETKQESTPSTK